MKKRATPLVLVV